ncbi:hypothetical protein XMG59_002333 [Marinobacterium sp. xm-g-59]|nr:hypothetical protein [Marinobacterium sp. xm-g-59]
MSHRKIWAAYASSIVFVLLSNVSYAGELSEKDDLTLAKECSKVYEFAGDSMSYYPSSIMSIEDDGALISTSIIMKKTVVKGAKNGWAEGKEVIEERLFTCLFTGVAKNEYDIEPVVGYEFSTDTREIYAVRAFIQRCTEPFLLNKGGCEKVWDTVASRTYDKKSDSYSYKGDWIENSKYSDYGSYRYSVRGYYRGKLLWDSDFDKLASYPR